MGFWERLTSEFIDVIDWPDDRGDQMAWRFERYGNAIKTGAKLTVREGQAAIFVNEGQIADVFPPGLFVLETANLPVLSTLQHWDHGFNSPFKAEVYFISLRRFFNLKWGTKNPVMLRDPEFGPVRLRAFGTYGVRISDPVTFLKEVVGVQDAFSADVIADQLRNIIAARFAGVLAAAKVPVLDLAANYDDMGGFLRGAIAPDLEPYGVELTSLLIENVSLPPAVEAALDRRTQMGVVGDLQRYSQFQAAESMRAAAENPGAAGAGMGAGMGMIWAQQTQPHMQPQSAPPPLPSAWHAALDGAAAGPFNTRALQGLISDGRLTRDTLVWRSGLPEWAPAGAQHELAGLFSAQTPPPLPPG